jgi:hypothetical protein
MQTYMQVPIAQPCLFSSAFIRVNPWPILFPPRCSILEMGLFGKIAFSRFSPAPFACFLLSSCGTFTLWNIGMEIECY